ncbi:RNA polymerase II-associated protein 1 [Chionoecetes opilio]|uniref:RNA polymerase II-associated protein 1 n=1 Tax=Chionoecetes opilio TaxID=41210 RepID=A0A8J4XLV6_CHIOP|nr:RNA polymerase II-associated protein 1 [Chionoecetes opilio]
MLRRPRPGETDEELLRQEEEMVARGGVQPSVKLVRPDKRKTDEGAAPGPGNKDAPKSKFAQDRATKKKKEGIKDQTVLAESVLNVPRAAVMGRVVEREAALHPPPPSQPPWCPLPSPHGFPQPTTLTSLVSLQTFKLGGSSYILQGDGVLRNKSEVDEIHQENLGRLSAMSHAERLRERQDLLSNMSEEQIAFIRSLRKGGGKLEMDKLKWMSDMPAPKPLKDNEGFVARFNFKGDILPYNADISYRQALHHHGEEPGRAGYSLDEIFQLVRSQVVQQRHQGLSILGEIFRNAKEGLYDLCLETPLVQLAVEAGAVLLLRFSLDDASHLVYKDGVRALHHLVASAPDELCLALAQPWTPGCLEAGVSSQLFASDKTRQELAKEEQDLKDHEVIKLDVVRALVGWTPSSGSDCQFNPLRPRTYLLEKIRPDAETVTHTIGILTRVARHSLSAAWNVASTPRLLAVIIESFLPHNVSQLLTGKSVASMSCVYGVPLRHALHLLRVLAAKGRQLAALLVNTHHIMDRLLVYVALEPSEVSMPLQEALLLSQEAYAMWSVLLAYGLTKPVESVASFYPMFVRQLVFYRDKVPLNLDQHSHKFNYDVGSHLVAALGRAVQVAATHSLLEVRARLNQGTVAGADGTLAVLPPPPLTWSHLQDLPCLVETCLAKWLSQLAREDSHTTYPALRLVGSCCTFLTTYYSKWKDQTSYSHEECLSRTENLYNNIISPFINSPVFIKLLSALPSHSSLCSSLRPGTSRDPINLGSLGCITEGGTVVPIVQPSSPFPLLTPFSTLLLTLNTLHPALIHPTPDRLLESEEIAAYLKKVCVSPRSLVSQWLTRAEIYFLCNILQLAGTSRSVGSARRVLFHEAALCVLPCIHKGDEHLVKELLTKVICAPEFTCDLAEIARGLGDMTLTDYEPLKSPALHQPALNPSQMTRNVYNALASIGNELSSVLITKKELAASSVLVSGIPFATNSITISHMEVPLILDQFWPLTPLKYGLKSRQKPQKLEESSQSKPEEILTVTRCLQMTYMGLKHRPRILLPASASHSSWLQHLSLAFLSASDLFLDPAISSYLQGCLVELLGKGGYAKMDLRHPIDCFASTSEWYRSLVDQYSGVSYGDSTFALLLITPLQQHCPKDFRTSLWGDASDALQFLFLHPDQVKRFIPLEQFLNPREEDEGLITRYRAAVGTGIITAKRNPLMHTIAEHHTHHFLARGDDKR